MKTISREVADDIRQFLKLNKHQMLRWVNDEDLPLQITIAINEDGTRWNYQTGDNSFTGGCYSLPHWAVDWIDHDTDCDELADDLIEALNDYLED